MKIVTELAVGATAGAVGTISMDSLWFARYKHAKGTDRFLDWETSAGLDSWTDAPAPAAFGRLVASRLLRVELGPEHARLLNNVMHWSTGIGWGAVYSIASRRAAAGIWTGIPFGAAVWLQSYAVLGAVGLYKPMWKYDASTLGKDLRAHLLYGLATGCTMSILT